MQTLQSLAPLISLDSDVYKWFMCALNSQCRKLKTIQGSRKQLHFASSPPASSRSLCETKFTQPRICHDSRFFGWGTVMCRPSPSNAFVPQILVGSQASDLIASPIGGNHEGVSSITDHTPTRQGSHSRRSIICRAPIANTTSPQVRVVDFKYRFCSACSTCVQLENEK